MKVEMFQIVGLGNGKGFRFLVGKEVQIATS